MERRGVCDDEMGMKYVQLYYTYREVISRLSVEEKGQILDAILDYAEFGKEPKLEGKADVVFPTFAMLIDRDKAAYEEKCRKLKENIEKRWHTKEYKSTQEEEKEKEKEKDTHYVRSRAPRKRKLKNNTEITLQKEDLFVPFWEVEGSEDEE